MEYEPFELSPEERAARRAAREERRRERRRRRRLRQLRRAVPLVLLLAAVGVLTAAVRGHQTDETPPSQTGAVSDAVPAADPIPVEEETPYAVSATGETVSLGEEIDSEYAVVIDVDAGTILGQKNADAVISPASMTKILTVLTAAELVEDLDDTVSITIEITDYCFSNGCSVAGFELGEAVPVRDLFYGAVLPSGADAALALALYTEGSEEAFVERMNEKAAELGLSDSAHFTNCAGLYGEDHHCTVKDMALILKAAMENELCRQALSAHTWTTAATEQHPEGMLLSNWFLRRIEDKDSGDMTVECAKTGYVTQSGSCAASSAVDGSGRTLICVTGMAGSSWRCIYDHAALYQRFSAAGT